MPQNLIGCVNLSHSLKGFSKPYLVVPSLGLGYCTEVGNWPKKSNALALEIVSQKCNALVIMH